MELGTALHQDGGWRLLADGRRVAVERQPFVAAPLAAGQHSLDLVYRPPGFLAGLVLAALGWLALLTSALKPLRLEP